MLAKLPSAPHGAEVPIQLQPAANGTGLTLQTSAAGTVYVEQVRLEQ